MYTAYLSLVSQNQHYVSHYMYIDTGISSFVTIMSINIYRLLVVSLAIQLYMEA